MIREENICDYEDRKTINNEKNTSPIVNTHESCENLSFITGRSLDKNYSASACLGVRSTLNTSKLEVFIIKSYNDPVINDQVVKDAKSNQLNNKIQKYSNC
jgi:hypothetical protein